MKLNLLFCYLLIFTLFQTLSAQNETILYTDKPLVGEQFGRSLAFAGNDWLVSGAVSNNKGNASGSVYVFKNINNQWQQSTKLIPPDTRTDDYFGLSLAACNNKSLITAYKNDERGTNVGAAYFYQEAGGNWYLRQKLMPSDDMPYQLFGSAVAMTEQKALISAVGDTENGFQSGAVYTYNYDGNEWQEKQKLTAPNGGANDEFGHSVSISGNLAVVGAWGSLDDAGNRTGSAYIYRYHNENWILEQQLIAPESRNEDRFGWSVSIKEGLIAVGAPGSDETGKNMGAVYLFTNQNKEWGFVQKIVPQGGLHGAGFGIQTLIGETGRIWISAEKTRTGLGTSGAVYCYVPDEAINTKWVQEIWTETNHNYTHARYGAALAATRSKLAVGAYLHSESFVEKCGSVAVYGMEKKTEYTNEVKLATDFIKIYPNPSYDGIFNLETDGVSVKSISVYTSLGILVFTIDNFSEHIVNKSILQVNLSIEGIYYIHILRTDGTKKVFRLVKI